MYYCKNNNVSYYKPMIELNDRFYQDSSMDIWETLTTILSYIFSIFFLAIFIIVGYLYLSKQSELIFNPIKYILLPNHSNIAIRQFPIYMVKSQKIRLEKQEIARINIFLNDSKSKREETKRKRKVKKAFLENNTHLKNIRTIVVEKGDTLYTLAEKAYGDASYYDLIFDANPKVLKTKKDLHIGQILSVPF